MSQKEPVYVTRFGALDYIDKDENKLPPLPAGQPGRAPILRKPIMTCNRYAGLGEVERASFHGLPDGPGPAGITFGFGSITYSHLIG